LQSEYTVNYANLDNERLHVKLRRLAVWAWTTLSINVLVILSGAYVRSTKSGDGCGNHWPLCNGEFIPPAPEVKTLIEFSHRLLTGLALIFVINLVIQSFRSYPAKHKVRVGAIFSIVFILIEALIGAGLVKFELVADNASMARAIYMSFHLVNTFLLIGALTLTAWWIYDDKPLQLEGQGIILLLFGLGFVGMLLLGMSGAVAALGDTLFPARSLAEALKQDLSPTSHLFIKLRFLHPTIALVTSLYIAALSVLVIYLQPSVWTRRFAFMVVSLIIVQLGAGLLNVLLLVPIWLQLVHLLLADLLWISLILLAANFMVINDRILPARS
jgi:heme A synthase